MTIMAHSFVVLFQIFSGIWPLVEPPEPTPPLPPPVKTMGAARGATCGQIVGLGNIFGESAVIRGEVTADSIPPHLARAVAAARIGQNRDQAVQFLSPFLGDGRDEASQYARLQLAYTLLRMAPLDAGAEAATIRELLSPEDAFAGSSDAHYIHAVVFRAEGKQAEALTEIENAVSINPHYYNAVMLRSLLLLADAERAFRASGSCEPMFVALEQAVVPVAELGPCPLQLAHFQIALQRALPQVKSSRHDEMLRILDLALAYAARKDLIHAELLLLQTEADPSAAQCTKELQRHDFGNPLE